MSIIIYEISGMYLLPKAPKRDVLLFRVDFLGLLCFQELICLSYLSLECIFLAQNDQLDWVLREELFA
jgi:hypothetical protein